LVTLGTASRRKKKKGSSGLEDLAAEGRSGTGTVQEERAWAGMVLHLKCRIAHGAQAELARKKAIDTAPMEAPGGAG